MLTMNEVQNFAERAIDLKQLTEQERGGKRVRTEMPIHQKCLLTLEEAAEYTGLGVNKLRSISNEEDCTFVLWNGKKRMFKRTRLDAYLNEAYSI